MQALLLGHHPLSTKELAILNDSLLKPWNRVWTPAEDRIMAQDAQSSFDELLDECDDLPDGMAKMLLLKHAVELADSIPDIDLAFATRMKLIGQPQPWPRDVLSVAFAWCVAHFDAEPKRPRFRHHVGLPLGHRELSKSFHVPRAQIEANDCRNGGRYRKVEASMRRSRFSG